MVTFNLNESEEKERSARDNEDREHQVRTEAAKETHPTYALQRSKASLSRQ